MKMSLRAIEQSSRSISDEYAGVKYASMITRRDSPELSMYDRARACIACVTGDSPGVDGRSASGREGRT